MDIDRGSATLERPVTESDTAAAWGAEFPAAASTPFVLGLAEVACHCAVREDLAENEITVGTGAVIEHLAPTPVGRTLTVHARLVGREGRKLQFVVEVQDGERLAARVEHTRAVVDRQAIMSRLESR